MAFSDIMSMFRTAPTAPVAQGAQNINPTQVNSPGVQLPGTQASSQTAANGVIPDQSQNVPDNQNVSPLDKFNDVWKTTPIPAGTIDPNASVFANVDPNKVMESARKVDFSKNITAEQLSAIGQGGDAAVKAFSESLNSVAQTVYANSTMATTKIVEQALEKQREQFNASLPSLVKKLSVNESLRTENPLLSNPAVQPLVEALTTQLTQKNPNATSNEIRVQVNDYFEAMAQTFTPKVQPTKAQLKASQADDWSKFME